ncbi:hypothetical protein HJD18_07345 [Thermoleophilia bacterium SCSIO 60948]|nr:hypothetical protein HJD18_07345 [Thermoleophilia bacterium SCSIO 60948]
MARVALASFKGLPDTWGWGEREVARILTERGIETELIPWDSGEADFETPELVVVRTTWNYVRHRDRFCAWADAIGDRLRNAPELIRWNSDKTYLGELGDAGVPVCPTTFVGPGEAPPRLEGEVAVKPTVSAGGRDTGRFSPAVHEAAHALIGEITASGRTAMVQPYLSSVDELGETAIVHFGGEPVNVLRKRAVLSPDEVAPVTEDEVGAATVMSDESLVGLGEAADDERELARRVVAEVARRFDGAPLICRVDMVRDPSGDPLLLELEAVEPNLYLELRPELAERLADAIEAELASEI